MTKTFSQILLVTVSDLEFRDCHSIKARKDRDREEIDLTACTHVVSNESRSRSYKIPKLKCYRSNHICKVEDISTPSRIHQVLGW